MFKYSELILYLRFHVNMGGPILTCVRAQQNTNKQKNVRIVHDEVHRICAELWAEDNTHRLRVRRIVRRTENIVEAMGARRAEDFAPCAYCSIKSNSPNHRKEDDKTASWFMNFWLGNGWIQNSSLINIEQIFLILNCAYPCWLWVDILFVYAVDDGTGVVPCILWRDDRPYSVRDLLEGFSVGDDVAICGSLRLYRDRKEISVKTIGVFPLSVSKVFAMFFLQAARFCFAFHLTISGEQGSGTEDRSHGQ